MPVPKKTPAAARSSSLSSIAASRSACAAATSASWLTRSSIRSRGAGKWALASNDAAAAIRVPSRALILGRTPMPERPAARFAKNSLGLLPHGATSPIPVTATRLIGRYDPVRAAGASRSAIN